MAEETDLMQPEIQTEITGSEPPVNPGAIIEGYQCPKCDRVFGTPQGLAVHDARKHRGMKWNSVPKGSRLKRRKGSFICPKCKKKFPREQGLRMHILRKHSAGSKRRFMQLPATCPICHKSFANKGGMAKHVREVHKQSLRDLPAEGTLKIRASAPQEEERRPLQGWDPRTVIFCPCCGCNIPNVQAAVRIGG